MKYYTHDFLFFMPNVFLYFTPRLDSMSLATLQNAKNVFIITLKEVKKNDK